MDSGVEGATKAGWLPSAAAEVHSDFDSLSLTTLKGWKDVSEESRDLLKGREAEALRSLTAFPGESPRRDADSYPLSSDLAPIRPPPERNDALSSTEDFELMVNDMRSNFVSWLNKTQLALRSRREDLARAAEDLQTERRSFVERMKKERAAEAERIAEERRRHAQEIASQLKHVHFEREEARRRIEEERQKLEHEKEVFANYMQLEGAKMRQRVELFEQDQRKVLDNKIATQTMVDINVGGVVFETSRHTLARQPTSFLANLVSGRHEVGRDRQGRIFLDRDYELFRVILNYMRNPECLPVPRDLSESTLILNEAEYYKVKFSPYPLALTLGGHDGQSPVNAVEMLDRENMCWRSCSPMQTARMYFGAGVLNNFVYVFGGHNLDYKALCDTEMYDRLRDTWHTVVSLKQARRNNGGCVFSDRLFCVGGFDGLSVMDSVETYDVRMRNWIPAAPLNTPRSSPMLAPQNGLLYALGGTSGERLQSVERYDPRMNKWETMPGALLKVRSAGSACPYNNEIYLIGGIDNVHNVHSSLETWNSATQASRYLMEAPLELMDTSLLCYGAQLLLTGGQNTQVSGETFFYRPESDEWSKGKCTSAPRQTAFRSLAAHPTGGSALLILSGGLATRLGTTFPKALLPISPVRRKTLLQLHMERLRRLCELLGPESPRPRVFILTSRFNHDTIARYLETVNFCGLDRSQVVLFQQGTAPCMRFGDYSYFPRAPDQWSEEAGEGAPETGAFVEAPNGNGAVFEALSRCEEFMRELPSLRMMHVIAIDNALSRPLDPEVMGLALRCPGVEIVNKCVRRRGVENVGVFCMGDTPRIVEYSELERLPDKSFLQGTTVYGNICDHVFSGAFLRRVIGERLFERLPYHAAKKVVPCYNEVDGSECRPAEPNGYTLELFIFDIFQFASRQVCLEVDRDMQFAPVKYLADCDASNVLSSQHRMSSVARAWLEAAGATLGEGFFDISPAASYAGEGLGRYSGMRLEGPMYIE
ncbi:kelch repeat and K+ channel tetramerization domain containing protein [Babesia caballi]|uniref:UDP-N-acetylglucosamine diphosphorylase n=1 Tax=Babesia caballi TaxID=5871 RepID=A0AAV4LUP4_BABCB|nr:kelch repeat and K+ channel tetramerization domain containing protein [Babesia caballi]